MQSSEVDSRLTSYLLPTSDGGQERWDYIQEVSKFSAHPGKFFLFTFNLQCILGRVEKVKLFQIIPCHVDSVDIHQNKEENTKERKIELIEKPTIA